MNQTIRSFLAVAFAFLLWPGMATAKAQLPARPDEGLPPAVFPNPTAPSADSPLNQPSAVAIPAPPAPRKPTSNSCNVEGTSIALTFDDGPHPKHTTRLLDMLKERGVKATFYVLGQNVVQYPEIMQRMVAEGHEIGNHSYTHPSLNKISAAKLTEEITKANEAILQSCGVRPPRCGLRMVRRTPQSRNASTTNSASPSSCGRWILKTGKSAKPPMSRTTFFKIPSRAESFSPTTFILPPSTPCPPCWMDFSRRATNLSQSRS